MNRHVIIIGGGFSGALLAVNLLRHEGLRVSLIERRSVAGRGVAYSTAFEGHLLNVPAGRMSAFPDRPDHFVEWLQRVYGTADAAAFMPRRVYGDYVQALLAEARAQAGERMTLVQGDVLDLDVTADGVTARLAGGQVIAGDAAVLAIGNLPPHTPPGIDPEALEPGRYWPDPWAPDIARGLEAEDSILLIGTGLTMVDVVLLLEDQDFGGRIVALSRRGLLPRPHQVGGPAAGAPPAAAPNSATQLLRDVRRRSEEIGWRASVDALRPVTQDLWRAAPLAERRRFLRHLRPWWDVHRHRIAPQIHARIEAAQADGRLEVIAAKLVGAVDGAGGVAVSWRPRGREQVETRTVQRIVNCTGPEGNLPSAREPLLRRLLEHGAIRPDPLRIGVDVDPEARAIGSDSAPNDRLFSVGPPTRGALWEINAVPDIRMQVWQLARRLAGA